MAEVTKEQEEEFKRRFKRKDSDIEFKELSEEQLKAFLKATDDKCDGDG